MTWTVRPRRRGPKPRPHRTAALAATFTGKLTLRQQAYRRHRSITAVKRRHRLALDALLQQPWRMTIPRGRLILLIDGLWWSVSGTRWVLYLRALRSLRGRRAVFLRPLLRPGPESEERWREAIVEIPRGACRRISALVSDSWRGVETVAASAGWVLQRCHAHLLRRVADVLGTRKRLRWLCGRRRAARRIRMLLTTTEAHTIRRCLHDLHVLAGDPACPRKARGVIREVIRRHTEYRSYLDYPDLRLPTTTNVVEGMNARLRELAMRSRGFRTVASLERWITACVRFHPTARCRPKRPQK